MSGLILPVCRVGLGVVHLHLGPRGAGDDGAGLRFGAFGLAFEMDMVQLAFNQVYIKDGWTWYRNGPDDELSACDLIRSAAETLGAEPPPLNDEELSDLLTDWLYYGVDEVEGVLGILYRALWAMAEIRARLSRYEDTGFMPDDVERLAVQEPNTPLTLEELRAMDGKPAWSSYYQCWGLISVCTSGKWAGVPFFLFTEDGCRHEKNVEQRRLTLYRRKPEEGAP